MNDPRPRPPPTSVPPPVGTRYLVIRSCARCGGRHELEARPFGTSAIRFLWRKWTHWATCPTTGEPILVEARGT